MWGYSYYDEHVRTWKYSVGLEGHARVAESDIVTVCDSNCKGEWGLCVKCFHCGESRLLTAVTVERIVFTYSAYRIWN